MSTARKSDWCCPKEWINGELVGLIIEQADDNLLASTRDKNTMEGIGNRTCMSVLGSGE